MFLVFHKLSMLFLERRKTGKHQPLVTDTYYKPNPLYNFFTKAFTDLSQSWQSKIIVYVSF